MRVSDKQLVYLMTTLLDSLRLNIVGDSFTYSQEQRGQIYNEVVSQQNNEPTERCECCKEEEDE